MERLREAVGLRSFRHVVAPKTAPQKAEPAKNAPTATFKQYREADGLFYFKLTLTGGRVLLTSKGFASGRDAGQSVAKLKSTCTLGDLEQNVVLGAGVTVAARAFRPGRAFSFCPLCRSIFGALFAAFSQSFDRAARKGAVRLSVKRRARGRRGST